MRQPGGRGTAPASWLAPCIHSSGSLSRIAVPKTLSHWPVLQADEHPPTPELEDSMRLAEALHHRKCLVKRIKMDQEALDAILMGRKRPGPQEEPQGLLRQIESSHAHLECLVIQIYKANAETLLPSGRTLIETIAHKETVSKRIEHLKALLGRLVAKSSHEPWPPTRAKVQELRLTPQALRNEINALTVELRELDRSIDSANWSTDLTLLDQSSLAMPAKAGGF